MTLYLDLPGDRGKLDRLVSEFGAVALPGPPRGLDAVPPDKALVCVGDMGEYEAPGYILTEAEFAIWTDAADEGVKTWLLMDRDAADALCPAAAGERQTWQEAMERDAEAVAHTDNLVPVARVSRRALGRDADLLRKYAAALGGPASAVPGAGRRVAPCWVSRRARCRQGGGLRWRIGSMGRPRSGAGEWWWCGGSRVRRR